jgi:hypothetical protein
MPTLDRLAEFEANDEKDGWLMHPRTRTVLEEQPSSLAKTEMLVSVRVRK